MDTEYWKVPYIGKNVNILVNVNGYFIVDKDLFVIFVGNKRLGSYETFKEAMGVMESLHLED